MSKYKHLTASALIAGVVAIASTSVTAADKKIISMSTIAPGTSANLTMTSFANIVNKALGDIEIQVDSTGAAAKHMVEAGRGKTDLILTAPQLYRWMSAGKVMYKKLKEAPKLAKNIRLVLWFPWGPAHVTTYADSGIKTLDDLRGKKVFIGPPGGGAYASTRSLIKVATGMDANKEYNAVRASWGSGWQAFTDKQIDAYVSGCLQPCSQYQQLTLTNKVRFLGVTKAEAEAGKIDKVYKGIPGRYLGKIEKGTYGKSQVNETDVYTLGVTVGIATHAGVSEDAMYKITKAFWKNLPAVQKEAPWMKHINIKDATKGAGLSFHKGAERYYKEIGLLK